MSKKLTSEDLTHLYSIVEDHQFKLNGGKTRPEYKKAFNIIDKIESTHPHLKEHEQSHWAKGEKSKPEGHTD